MKGRVCISYFIKQYFSCIRRKKGMKKKVLSVLLVAAMSVSVLAGCGSKLTTTKMQKMMHHRKKHLAYGAGIQTLMCTL
jgi:hypothetical protein